MQNHICISNKDKMGIIGSTHTPYYNNWCYGWFSSRKSAKCSVSSVTAKHRKKNLNREGLATLGRAILSDKWF